MWALKYSRTLTSSGHNAGYTSFTISDSLTVTLKDLTGEVDFEIIAQPLRLIPAVLSVNCVMTPTLTNGWYLLNISLGLY